MGAAWTIYTYQDTKRDELEQQKYSQKKDEQMRTKEQNEAVFNDQASIYLDVSQAAATLALAVDPDSDDAKAIESGTVKKARQEFEQFYWGKMVVVEDRRVEIAMVKFRECLLAKGKNCERGDEDQHGNPIREEVIGKLDDPTLLDLSLELSACMRSALEHRKIEFGAVEQALTFCPYD